MVTGQSIEGAQDNQTASESLFNSEQSRLET